MFNLNDQVIVTQGRYTGYIGTVVRVFPHGILCTSDIYIVKYDAKFCTGSGQFETDDLKLYTGE